MLPDHNSLVGISVLPGSSPLRPRRPRRFFLLSVSESTAEDAEDAEEKRECASNTLSPHYPQLAPIQRSGYNVQLKRLACESRKSIKAFRGNRLMPVSPACSSAQPDVICVAVGATRNSPS